MGMGAGMGGGGHANNPTFMFQARCGPLAPRHLRGARRIARRARKNCAAPRAPSPRPPSRRTPIALSRLPPPHPAPVLVAQADWNKNKWKGAVFVLAVTGLGCYIPYKCARAAAARCAAAAAARRRPPPQPRSPTRPPPLLRAMDFAQKKAGVEW